MRRFGRDAFAAGLPFAAEPFDEQEDDQGDQRGPEQTRQQVAAVFAEPDGNFERELDVVDRLRGRVDRQRIDENPQRIHRPQRVDYVLLM